MRRVSIEPSVQSLLWKEQSTFSLLRRRQVLSPVSAFTSVLKITLPGQYFLGFRFQA